MRCVHEWQPGVFGLSPPLARAPYLHPLSVLRPCDVVGEHLPHIHLIVQLMPPHVQQLITGGTHLQHNRHETTFDSDTTKNQINTLR